MENARLECPTESITHAFIHFKYDEGRNKFVRSATMLKKVLRRRKWKLSSSMDADESFLWQKNGTRLILHSWEASHPSRFDNHELDTEAHISERSDCGKDVSKWKLTVHQIPRHWNKKSKDIWKNGNQKTRRKDCEQSRERSKTKGRRNDYEQHKETNKPRRRDQRHDRHGKWAKMCHDYFHGHHTW